MCEAFSFISRKRASNLEATLSASRYLAMKTFQTVILGRSGSIRQPFKPSTQFAPIEIIHSASLVVNSSWHHKQSLPSRQDLAVIHVSKQRSRSKVSSDPYFEDLSFPSYT